MAVVRKNITITPEHEQLIAERQINLSRLIQNELDDIASNVNKPDFYRNLNDALKKQVEKWREVTQNMRDFMQKKGVLDEYLRENGY